MIDIPVDNHIGILGKTGSGKSNLAKVITESLLDEGQRVCAIDPTGTWWGLRLTRAGKPSKYPIVIFGGHHADLPIGPTHGRAIAEAVGSSSTPVIIDTRTMKVGERTRFFTDFAEALLQSNKGPLHLIIDEAHLFMPQGKVNDPQSGQMLHAGNNLVSLGRGNGIRVTMISQRPAKLHKDSLTQIETLIAMRLIAPQDRNAVSDWINEWANPKEARDLLASLPSLKVGEGWLWAPALDRLEHRVFPLAATFDSGRPSEGNPPNLTPIDIKAISGQLAKVAEEAKANDPAALKAEIARLKKGAAKPALSADALVDAHGKGQEEGHKDGWNEAMDAMRGPVALAMEALKEIDAAIAAVPPPPVKPTVGPRLVDPGRKLTNFKIGEFKIGERGTTSFEYTIGNGKPGKMRKPAATIKLPSGDILDLDSRIPGPEQRLLDSLATWREMGHEAPTAAMAAWLARYTPSGSSFEKARGALNSKGLIAIPSPGHLALTPEGAALARPSPVGDLGAFVLMQLPGPEKRVLEPLLRLYPADSDAESVAVSAGYAVGGSSFEKARGSLRSKALLTIPSPGRLRAADWLGG